MAPPPDSQAKDKPLDAATKLEHFARSSQQKQASSPPQVPSSATSLSLQGNPETFVPSPTAQANGCSQSGGGAAARDITSMSFQSVEEPQDEPTLRDIMSVVSTCNISLQTLNEHMGNLKEDMDRVRQDVLQMNERVKAVEDRVSMVEDRLPPPPCSLI